MDQGVTRRSVLGGLVGLGVGAMVGVRSTFAAGIGRPSQSVPTAHQDANGLFTLPELPYGHDALEPHIDAMTMEIHHSRHHNAYVTNLNNVVADLPEFHDMSPEELIQNLDQAPDDVRTAIRNNGGGHVNHTLFWEIMGPNGGGEPTGTLADAIASAFGDLATMQDAVNTAGLGRFGSGWSWLVVNGDGELSVTSTPNQDSPLMDGTGTPILGIDVWEHAYYLHYQNRRADYLEAWWNTINWEAVATRYDAAGTQ